MEIRADDLNERHVGKKIRIYTEDDQLIREGILEKSGYRWYWHRWYSRRKIAMIKLKESSMPLYLEGYLKVYVEKEGVS